MNPDDLQAIVWFGEKHVWDTSGWTGNVGAFKSSFDEAFDVFYPEGKPPRPISHGKNIVTFLQKERLLKADLATENWKAAKKHKLEYEKAKRGRGVAGYIKERGLPDILKGFPGGAFKPPRRNRPTNSRIRGKSVSGTKGSGRGVAFSPSKPLNALADGDTPTFDVLGSAANQGDRGKTVRFNMDFNHGPWQNSSSNEAKTNSPFSWESAFQVFNESANAQAMEPGNIAKHFSGRGTDKHWTEAEDYSALAELDRQDALIQEWAKESGWYIDPSNLDSFAKAAKDFKRGNEHTVVINRDKMVVRATNGNKFGLPLKTPAQYFRRIADYNSVVSADLGWVFLGISSDAQGNGVILTAQKFAEGREPSQQELDRSLKDEGWTSSGEEDSYRHTSTGVIMRDASPRNILIGFDKKLKPIDVWIDKPAIESTAKDSTSLGIRFSPSKPLNKRGGMLYRSPKGQTYSRE